MNRIKNKDVAMKLYQRAHHKFLQTSQLRLSIYFFIVLLPLVIISLYVNNRANQIIIQKTTEQTQDKVESVMNNLELSLHHFETLTNLIAANHNINEKLKVNGSGMSPRTIVQYSELLQELWNISAVSLVASQITIYQMETHTMISTKYGGKRIESATERESFAYLNRLADQAGTFLMSQPKEGKEPVIADLVEANSVSLVRRLNAFPDKNKASLLVVTLHKNALQTLISPLLSAELTSLQITNREGESILSVPNGDPEKKRDGDVLKVSVQSSSYPIRLEVFRPIEEIYKETKTMRQFTYLIIACSFVLSMLISWGIYNRIASPLGQLKNAMKGLIGGDYDIRLHTRRKDEFGYLMDSYNRMAEHQKHLIQDHYEQQLRIARTELTFLQSQINPHFLYNTLNSIYWTAQNYEAEEISEMVLNLSHFFRLSLHKGQDTFTVEETITHLSYYLRVQQIRFLHCFQVVYEIHEETKTIPVLKLLLQPLVENAVIHGLEQMKSNGLLVISSFLQQGKLMITVQDNGSGISGQRLQSIYQVIQEIDGKTAPFSFLESPGKELYGLRNVCSRMKMFYGSDAHIRFESQLGVGTTVTLELPLSSTTDE
ncbi:integral membrane sensor signal transduction histidine kinase [Paenibacillus alvei TS-15]|jgi:two-component system, sensor histidine kinase YesM|uniref:histidine kinase n=2 Tax=Paenibacillus TaxID=44249 RepID=S9TYN3_PAEAL|nr:histidine kinase [Paenibacillus alvei]EPY07341.1 integral membrane sensor signal transduction histidine kinase [Paenibacillus alvei TS-15]